MHTVLLSQDLDETLFYSSTRPLKGRDPDLAFDKYFVYFRPGAKEYLKKVLDSPSFKLGVYTAATEDYAKFILKHLLPEGAELEFFFDRKRLVKRDQQSLMPYSYFNQDIYFKDLKKVKRETGFDYDKIIAIDDKPLIYPRQYSNVVAVPEYNGQTNDRTLDYLWRFLNVLSRDINVRPREKRGWLRKFENRNEHAALQL